MTSSSHCTIIHYDFYFYFPLGRIEPKEQNNAPTDSADSAEQYHLSVDSSDSDYGTLFRNYSPIIPVESIDEFENDRIDLMENAFKGWLEIYIRVVESKDFETENSRIDEK